MNQNPDETWALNPKPYSPSLQKKTSAAAAAGGGSDNAVWFR